MLNRKKIDRNWIGVATLAGYTASGIIFSPYSHSAGPIDSGFLKSSQTAQPKKGASGSSSTPFAPTSRSKTGNKADLPLDELKGGGLSAEDPAAGVSYDTIVSLTELMKKSPAGAQRNTMLLNRAAAMNLFARKTHLASKKTRIDDKLLKYFEAAIRDANEVLASPLKTQEQVSRSHYLIGFSNVYLDRSNEARKHFAELLRLSPNSPNAGWVALYVAEDLFEERKFTEAVQYYNGYYTKMSTQGKELALYKLAWCMINLQREDRAEELFIRLVKTGSKQGLSRDAMRDLAFIMTHRPNPWEGIKKTEALFPDVQDKIDFLNHARFNLESQNSVAIFSLVIERLLELEQNSEKRLELYLANLKAHRKLFAAQEHMDAFTKLANAVKDAGYTSSSREIQKFAPVMEAELQLLMKGFADTYGGKTQTPEKLTKSDLAKGLKSQAQFFSTFLVSSPLRPQVVDLWMDVCVDMKDWQCVDTTAEFILADSKRLAMHVERAYIDQIAALDQLEQDQKLEEQKRKDYAKRKFAKMKYFVEKYFSSKHWIPIARKFAQMNVDIEQFSDAVAILAKVYQREPTSEGFYRLQYARFKAEEYEAILTDLRWDASHSPEPRVVDLRRETSLILAQKARKDEDVQNYSKHIHRFLSLNPDPKKAMIARVDYFSFMLDKKHADGLSAEFLQLSPSLRESKDLEGIRLRLWSHGMEKGKYRDAKNVVTRPPEKENADAGLLYRRVLATIASGTLPTKNELKAISTENREYLYGLLVLVQPDMMISTLASAEPAIRPKKDLLELALRIKSGQWKIVRSKEATTILGKDYKFALAESNDPLPVENKIGSIEFPDSTTDFTTLGRKMETLLKQTRKTRSSIPGAIQGKSASTQLRVLEKARDLEKKVADFIAYSPLPPQLSQEQADQYKAGLADAAKEFLNQAGEFEKLAATIRDTLSKESAANQARLLPFPPMSEWDWPSNYHSNYPLKLVAEAAQAGNILGALVMLDFLRPEHVKDDMDYFRIRGGLLLSSSRSESLRIYLLGELEANKALEVIGEWKTIAKVPTSPEATGEDE